MKFLSLIYQEISFLLPIRGMYPAKSKSPYWHSYSWLD